MKNADAREIEAADAAWTRMLDLMRAAGATPDRVRAQAG
jgi:hypothetical protein